MVSSGSGQSAVRYFRKVIRISAADSPNVKSQRDDILPGVLSYTEYLKRRATWDKVRQCVGLDGVFYEGGEVLLFPPEWLNRAEDFYRKLTESLPSSPHRKRSARGIGVDPGEGTAETSMYAVDEFGVIEGISRPTPDTSVIRREVLAFMRRHSCPPERVCFDRGGGGKQIADELRFQGHPVRTVAFGESVQLPIKKGTQWVKDRREIKEGAYAYKNRRAQMYGNLSLALDPNTEGFKGFALPPDDIELRRQLAPLPKSYDEEGRLWLPPKNKRDSKDTRRTLTEMLGCSPDRADALVLALYAMTNKDVPMTIEVM